MRSIFKVGLVGMLCGATMAAGAALVHFDTVPYQMAKKAVRVIFPKEAGRAPQVQAPAEVTTEAEALKYESILLQLEGQSVDIPPGRIGNGGALTAVGDDVLLVTHDGLFYHATGPDDVAGLRITAPENNFEAYFRDSRGKFQDLQHRTMVFRYNDVLYLDAPEGSQLLTSFTRYFPEKTCYVNAIARLKLPTEDLRGLEVSADQWETIYETDPCLPVKSTSLAIEGHMAGGRLAYDGDGTLYMASGDYHIDGSSHSPDLAISNDPAYDYGKVIALDLETLENRQISRGNRNMQGLALLDGEIYVVEHGARGGDELNRIREGANYGWPFVSLGTDYNKRPQPGTVLYGRHDGYEKPVFSWLPSVAISSLNPIEAFHESWDGDLLMGSLKSRSLFRIRIEEGRVLLAEQIQTGERIRYALPVGNRIVLWTDSRKLIFVTGKIFGDTDPVEEALKAQDLSQDEIARLSGRFTACRECHAVNPDDNYAAPTLANVFGAPIAGGAYADYSDALRAKGGVWDREALTAYLTDPESFASGTIMPGQGLSAEAVSDTITVLEALSAAN